MTAVQEVVTEQMRRANLGSYVGQATPIIETLAEREYAATDRLIQFAVGQGLSREQAVRAMTEAGLSIRPAAVPTVDSATIDAMQDTVNKLQGEIDRLRRR